MDNTTMNLSGDRKRRAENAARAMGSLKPKCKGGCDCNCPACRAKRAKQS